MDASVPPQIISTQLTNFSFFHSILADSLAHISLSLPDYRTVDLNKLKLLNAPKDDYTLLVP